jgi:hypothetical protein
MKHAEEHLRPTAVRYFYWPPLVEEYESGTSGLIWLGYVAFECRQHRFDDIEDPLGDADQPILLIYAKQAHVVLCNLGIDPVKYSVPHIEQYFGI